MMQEKERPTRFDDPGKALDGSRAVNGAEEALTTDEPSSDDVIEAVVQGLNRLCRQATFEFTLAVGEMVIDKVYGGGVDCVRSRDPTKNLKFRKYWLLGSLSLKT